MKNAGKYLSLFFIITLIFAGLYMSCDTSGADEDPTYTVYYDPNPPDDPGNPGTKMTVTGTMAPSVFTYGKDEKLRINDYVCEGFAFWEWEAPDGNTYQNGATVNSITSDDSITLKAKWEAGKYKVTYLGNGASGTVPGSQEVTYGNNITLSIPAEDLKRGNYTFAGWNTLANGTGTDYYVAGVTVTITANAAQTGKIFDKWITTDGVVFADASSATTTFIMPNKAVTVTATYKDWPTEPEYTIISGANGSVKIDSANGYTFTISGDYSKFDRLEVTGVTLIKGVDYTAASGSTIITITKTGLEKIGIGTKTITAHFIDGGTVTTTLTINAAAGNGGGNTGLIIGIAAGVVVLLGSGFCLYWFVIRKKKVAQ